MSDRWVDDALCAQTDPEAFHPVRGDNAKAAKSICGRCEVRAACLRWALDTNQRGPILGGLTDRERQVLKREARRSAA